MHASRTRQALHARPASRRATQAGAATLVVVMILFFVVSLAAAYASRNLIFEQRTSANQLRATKNFDAAEAGIEWALTMLNSGRIDGNCDPTNDTTRDNFRDRYSITNTTNAGYGFMQARTSTPGGGPMWAACALVNGVWECRCPTAAESLSTSPLPAGESAFSVRLATQGVKTGSIRLEVVACDSADLNCLRGGVLSLGPRCESTACAIASLYSAVRTPPAAAITARGNVSGSFSAGNPDHASGGLAVLAGGSIDPAVVTVGPAGMPPSLARRAGEALLATGSALPADTADCVDCLFASMFGLRPDTYRRLGAVIEVDCTTTCDAAELNLALDTGRGRALWLRGAGGLTLSATADVIGSATAPVTIVSEGPVTLEASAAGGTPLTSGRVHGLVYAPQATLDGGAVIGALVSQTTVSGSGSGAVIYDAEALRALRLQHGTFVRAPGAWRDFP